MAVAAYPKPRTRTGSAGAPVIGGGGTVSIPRTRLWPFECQAGSNNCSVAVSTRFHGPAVIDSIEYNFSTAGATGDLLLDFLVGPDDSGARVNAADGTKPTGVSILDPAVYSDAGVPVPAPGPSLTVVGTVGIGTQREWTIRRAVLDPDFFLKAYLRSANGINSIIYGTIRVVEGLTDEQLPNFL